MSIERAVETGWNFTRSTTRTYTPLHNSFLYFGFGAAVGSADGVNEIGSNATPVSFRLFNASARLSPLIHGAPIYSNGFGVPRPSVTFVPSNKHVPGYTVAVASVFIFGEGGIHGSPDSSYHVSRFQPSMGITVRSTVWPGCSRNHFSFFFMMPQPP